MRDLPCPGTTNRGGSGPILTPGNYTSLNIFFQNLYFFFFLSYFKERYLLLISTEE